MRNTVSGIVGTALAAAVFSCPAYSQTANADPDKGRESASETLFTMTNDADRNQIVAYVSEQGGAFREAHRFDTGGRGSGGGIQPLQNQGALTLSQDRSLLFAVNPGSGELSVFRVFGDDLLLVDKVTTGGAAPVSVTQRGNRVYVLNQGGSGTITGYSLTRDGRLMRIPKATGQLTGVLTGGSQVGISPDGRFLVATEQVASVAGPQPTTNFIDIYAIHSDGTLGTRVSSPSVGVTGFDFSFALGGQLLVTNAGSVSVGPPTFGSGVTSYSILPNGKLSPITRYVPSIGVGPCWSVLSPNGKLLYTADTFTSNISAFTVGADGSLTAFDSTVLAANPANSVSADLALSSDGKFLYNLNPGTNTIGVFGVNADGTLTTLSPIDVLGGLAFTGIAAL